MPGARSREGRRRGLSNSAPQQLGGHWALLFTAAGPGGTVLVQTRGGALVQDRWPDLVAAAESQLPHGLVLDGELVVRDTGAERLSFEALQCRAATSARGAAGLAAPNAPVHHAQPFSAVWPAADRPFRDVLAAPDGPGRVHPVRRTTMTWRIGWSVCGRRTHGGRGGRLLAEAS
ncbi:hypothetical protein Snoj_25730 [Streptomyces nojiriensis]|uniref:ATP-dependent DNA ligase family profile domain-containing protein n=1 Tax=Streptomyces nojiriensis TaxID=66374 RepID=A0ABQ3SLB4_9ACTN|nr:hypothetical protein GCM10010205_69330 [Streptomyces nojiriensis]GHI68655.1 hypothetical protein Snoj_25730 [Streptomyces nojiriensis]